MASRWVECGRWDGGPAVCGWWAGCVLAGRWAWWACVWWTVWAGGGGEFGRPVGWEGVWPVGLWGAVGVDEDGGPACGVGGWRIVVRCRSVGVVGGCVWW